MVNFDFLINNLNNRRSGLYVVYGPMFCDKSSSLIRSYLNELDQGRKPIAFNYFQDNRYGNNRIASHNQSLPRNQRYCPAHQLKSVGDIFDKLKGLNESFDTFIIDEVNLLDETILDFCYEQRNQGKRVIVAGLNLSFRGEHFPFRKWLSVHEENPKEDHFSNQTMEDLINLADFKISLKSSKCFCGKIAEYTQRLNQDGTISPYNSPLLIIGAGKDLNSEHDYYYEPRCLDHFIKPQ